MSRVYGVHSVKPGEISATAVIYTGLSQAETYAKELSLDPGVLAASVNAYVLGEPGTRSGVALYVQGRRQERPHVSDDRQIFSGAHGSLSTRH